jgi:hypothetical protein
VGEREAVGGIKSHNSPRMGRDDRASDEVTEPATQQLKSYARSFWLWLNSPAKSGILSGAGGDHHVRSILGEFLREIAVLVLVFGILDPMITPQEVARLGWPLWACGVFGVASLALGFGGLLEVSGRRRMGPFGFLLASGAGLALLGVAALGLLHLGEPESEATPGLGQGAGADPPPAPNVTANVVQALPAAAVATSTSVAYGPPTASPDPETFSRRPDLSCSDNENVTNASVTSTSVVAPSP